MSIGIKQEMIARASTLRGLANLLKDDAEYICSDVRDFDLIALGESIREAKDTVQSLINMADDLENMLHLAKTK